MKRRLGITYKLCACPFFFGYLVSLLRGGHQLIVGQVVPANLLLTGVLVVIRDLVPEQQGV